MGRAASEEFVDKPIDEFEFVIVEFQLVGNELKFVVGELGTESVVVAPEVMAGDEACSVELGVMSTVSKSYHQ